MSASDGLRTPEAIRSQILRARGITAEAEETFLRPDFSRDTHSPWEMKGMEAAVARIVRAIKEGERITVYGDYDADGVPATALVARAFRRLGVTVQTVIPTRAAGYGLTMGAVGQLVADGVQLLVTVDNGTVSREEIAALAEAGIDTVVCDHHQPQEGQVAERAVAILNPKQADCPYPFKELCACAIAWKLLSALYERLGADAAVLKWELDLVAVSTIADMVPLTGENRVLALYGLTVLRKTRNAGLRALAEASAVKLESVDAGDIGFRLAPRINAPSRMHAELVGGQNAPLSLLATEDQAEARRLAAYLHERNAERQALLDRHLQEAAAQVPGFADRNVLVVHDSSWSTGVIGLVAGRLLEQVARPVIVLAEEGGIIKGSVRSVEGIDAVELVKAGEALLERYGGHAKAAGLTFATPGERSTAEAVAEFRAALEEWMAAQGADLTSMAAQARRPAELELALPEITLELAHALVALGPFGIGFPAPLFSAVAEARAVRTVGSAGQHLSVMLADGVLLKKGIAFRYAGEPVAEGVRYRFFFALEAETWREVESPVCRIRRIEPV